MLQCILSYFRMGLWLSSWGSYQFWVWSITGWEASEHSVIPKVKGEKALALLHRGRSEYGQCTSVIHCCDWAGNPGSPPCHLLLPVLVSLFLLVLMVTSSLLDLAQMGAAIPRSSSYWNPKSQDEGDCSDHWGPGYYGQDNGGLVSEVHISDSQWVWESCQQKDQLVQRLRCATESGAFGKPERNRGFLWWLHGIEYDGRSHTWNCNMKSWTSISSPLPQAMGCWKQKRDTIWIKILQIS